METHVPAEFLLKYPPENLYQKTWKPWNLAETVAMLPQLSLAKMDPYEQDWANQKSREIGCPQCQQLWACKELDLRYLHLGEETHQLVRNPQ